VDRLSNIFKRRSSVLRTVATYTAIVLHTTMQPHCDLEHER